MTIIVPLLIIPFVTVVVAALAIAIWERLVEGRISPDTPPATMAGTYVFFLVLFYAGWFDFAEVGFGIAIVLAWIAHRLAQAAEEKEKRRWARIEQALRARDQCWIKLKNEPEADLAKIVPGSIKDSEVDVTYPDGLFPDMEFTIKFADIERLAR